MPSFADYQSTALAPGWLQDESTGKPYERALGSVKDALVARTKEAVKARFPSVAPPDALGLIASERGVDRGATESEDNHRGRVAAAWDTWRWAGTPYGLLLAFYWAGYRPTSGRVVLQVQLGKQYELRSDFDPAVHAPEAAVTITALGTVHLGGAPELFNQFSVLFVAPTLPSWIPSPPADASPEVDAIRSIIRRWKPGHARCVALKVTTVDLWDYPTAETWEPTTEIWDEAGVTASWTPPAG